jgi:hypothetical protein
MPGKVQSYETTQIKKGPKNKLLGVRPVRIMLWQLTDRKGSVHTELGIELEPGKILKFPADLLKEARPVNDKLQQLLLEQLHPELVKANAKGPKAAPVSRTPRKSAAQKLPKEVEV